MTDHGGHGWSGLRTRLFALIRRNPASNRAVVEWARLDPGDHVLDVGCGVGAAVKNAAAILGTGVAVGVDPSPESVRIGRRRARSDDNARFGVGDATRLPFAAHSFDVAWSVHSTHHWDDLEAGFAEVLRVLRPGGRFLVVERHDPGRPWGISQADAHRLAAVLAELGFDAPAVSSHRIGRSTEYLITAAAPPAPL